MLKDSLEELAVPIAVLKGVFIKKVTSSSKVLAMGESVKLSAVTTSLPSEVWWRRTVIELRTVEMKVVRVDHNVDHIPLRTLMIKGSRPGAKLATPTVRRLKTAVGGGP